LHSQTPEREEHWLSVRTMPTLGLSMIAKNEAHALPFCLGSVKHLVSQIVVADTGSSDDTAEIARSFGATVISIPWNNHFAEARNAALQAMETDWVLVLDPDEEIDKSAALPKLLAADAAAYLVPIRNYVPTPTGRGWDRMTEPNDRSHPRAKDAPAYFVHENCRLFRRSPEIYFTGRVHELVEQRLSALHLTIARANFFIHHFGQLVGEEKRSQKALSYLNLLRLKVRELSDDPLAWVQLGLQEYECSRNAEEALRCFNEAIRLEPRIPEAWTFRGMVLLNTGKCQEALEALGRVESSVPGKILRIHLRADALHNLGRLEESRTAYREAVRLTHNDPVLLSKLGYTEVKLGYVQQGFEKLGRASHSAPGLAEIRERLMKACIVLDRLPEAAEHAEQLARIDPHPRSFLRAAGVRMHLKQKEKAAELIEQGLQMFPTSADLQQALSELV